MPRSVEHRVGLIGALAILLFAGVSTLALWNTRRLVNASRWVSHSDEVMVELESLRYALETVESNVRAYALSGNAADLATYDASGADAIGHLGQLRQLVAGDVVQQRHLDRLQAALLGVLSSMGDLRRGRTARGEPVTALTAAEHERSAMQSVQETLTAMREEERRLMADRAARTEEINQHTALILGLTSALGALAMMVALRLLMRHERSRTTAERALRASEVQLRLVIDNMLAGLLIIDEYGTIELANPAAEQIFGCSASQLVGHPARGLIVLPDADANNRADDQIVGLVPRRALGQVTEWQGRRRDGRTFPLELALFEFDTEGRHHFAAIAQDISERHAIGRMKDEFVSVVSHELRTPLTSMRGGLQLVLADPPVFQDPEQEPLLHIALSNCERLIRIINDILDVSKIDAGQMTLKCQPCDPAYVVRTSIQNIAETARDAQVRIEADLDESLPPMFADFDRIVQVIVNLLSNAIKFAPPRSTVTVRTRAADDRIAVSVEDRGPGIAANDLEKLFQRFKQLDSSDTRRRGGTGLGLAIVKALVQQHNGSVTVESRVGEGTTFTVTIPIARTSVISAAQDAPVRRAVNVTAPAH